MARLKIGRYVLELRRQGKRSAPKPRNDPPVGDSFVTLRMPSSQHDQIKEIAGQRHRTLAGQIRFTMNRYVEEEEE